MNRASLGSWGVRLSSEDFACAIAAAGIASVDDEHAESIAERLVSLATSTGGLLVWLMGLRRKRESPSAEVLRDGWKLFLARRAEPFRVEAWLYGHDFDPFWLVSELSRVEVGAASVYVGWPHRRPAGARWHWPLRLAFLPGPASERAAGRLSMEIETHQWSQPLISIVDLAAAGGRCDMLVAPSDIRSALAGVLSFAGSMESPCVVVAGEIGGSAENIELAEVLAQQTGAEALALVNPGNQTLEQWILALLAHISHDAPFDIALASSLGAPSERPFHFLMANGEWIDGARLSAIAGTLRDKLGAEGLAKEELSIGPELASRLYLRQGSHSIQQLRQFADYYRHETEGATTLAMLSNAVAPRLREFTEPAERRYLQARVLPPGKTAEQRAAVSFRAGALHKIDVRVGPIEEQWVSSAEAFPEEKLPPSPRGHWLTVVASSPSMAPQTGRIYLPPRGPGTSCSFYLDVAEDQERVQMRIAVLYKNRVLQTSMLEGPVVRDVREIPEAEGISVSSRSRGEPGNGRSR